MEQDCHHHRNLLVIIKAPTIQKAFVLTMQPVPSLVWTIPGNTHQHLPVMLTMVAGWQSSNHPFFFLQQVCLESSDEVLSV